MNYLSLIKKYGLNEIKEQKEFLTNPSYESPVKPLVLAGGTGFGKTFTTILKLIMFYSNPENKGKKTIILPSSTKVLRNNFGESMDTFSNLPFNYCVCTGKRDFKRAVNHSDCNVIIVLPQTLASIKELPKVEWLVVDEAHKWYFAKTIGEIITKTKPSYQLLLTGTPFKFNAKKDDYLMFYVPIEDMIAAGNVGNPLIEVVSSSINLKDDDYNNTNNFEVNSLIQFSYKEDKDQLVSVAKEINKTLKTRMRKYTIGRVLGVFGIDKTIIYCYSKKQARHFYKAFQNSDLAGKVLLSDSESDIDSTEFNKFKEEEDHRVLLVVDRGKEGFDMPELFNIVDFTLSTNPEIILQILGRVLRISKLQPNKQKIYYKVASQNTASFILTLMTGVLQLIKREYYSTFTGKFDEIKIPMMPRKKPTPGPKRKNTNNFSTRALQYFQDVNIPLEANFWNQLKFRQGDIWKTMGQTDLKQVLFEMTNRSPKYFMTPEQGKGYCVGFENSEQMIQSECEFTSYVGRQLQTKKWDENIIAPHFNKTRRRKTREGVINIIEEGLKDGSIIKYRDLIQNGKVSLYTLKRLEMEREVKEKYFGYDFTPKPKKVKVRGKWTLEYSKEMAPTFKNRTEMAKKAQQGWHMLKDHDLLDVYFPKNNNDGNFTLKTK